MKIRTLEINETKNGDPYCRINGEYFIWKEGELLWQGLKKGDEVELKYKDGKYKTITHINNKKVPERKWEKKKDFFEKKQEFIAKTVNQKEDSIKMAGSQRDAVLIVTTFYPELAEVKNKDEEIKKKLQQWQNHFYNGKITTPF